MSLSHSNAQNEEVAAVVTVDVESVSSSFSTVVVGVESIVVAVVAAESVSSSFLQVAVLVVGAPVVVDLSAGEFILYSCLDVVVVCCCITVESA